MDRGTLKERLVALGFLPKSPDALFPSFSNEARGRGSAYIQGDEQAWLKVTPSVTSMGGLAGELASVVPPSRLEQAGAHWEGEALDDLLRNLEGDATSDIQAIIEATWDDRARLQTSPAAAAAVVQVIRALDRGALRVAEPGPTGGDWILHEWVQKAVMLYFSVAQMEVMELPPFEFRDKVPIKKGLEKAGIRVVPPGVARFGSFLAPGCVLMPGYVNIGAYVGEGTMVDTWATVGSCAPIGAGVHLSGGVGIGGVLEPIGARPVIIEDGCFIGSRSIIVEGVHVEREAVIAANTVLTASTRIIDVTDEAGAVVHKGRVPARSVVIPGSIPKQFPAGTFHVPAALIIGQRKESTDRKTSLNQVLREFSLQV